jgi:hypothetical protein
MGPSEKIIYYLMCFVISPREELQKCVPYVHLLATVKLMENGFGLNVLIIYFLHAESR